MIPGIEFRETMAGSFRLEGDAADRPISFTIRARSPKLLAFLRRPEVAIEGEVDAEGFADHRLLRGTLGLDVVRTGELRYAFRFVANDRAEYAFEGKKTIDAARLAESMTVLPGVIRDAAGAAIGRALLRFDLRGDFVKFVRSFRLSTT